MVSCVDTIILPDDKTVDEDFWKSKSDVALMVNGAYKSMLTDAVMARLIVWGGLRSDELLPNTGITGVLTEDLRDINLANTQPDNQFATWGSIYSVINNCNIVLSRAAAVMGEDPSYTQGDYLADRSQMLALRALCYFYLVRNFRDVPYHTTAYMTSSINRDLPQTAPATVLASCITDLLEAERNAISASAYNDWRRVGYFTRDGIQSLLADIYLWRASVMHNASDYEQAVIYCNRVIESKKNQHVAGRHEVGDKEFPLANGGEAFADIFVTQNAEESIFELQFNGTNNAAIALQQYYARVSSSNNAPYLYAPSKFHDDTEGIYVKTTNGMDYRLSNTFNSQKTVDEYDVVNIRKYVSKSTATGNVSNTSENVAYNNYNAQNFIIYRLTDVMLMKAEALAALAQITEDNAPEGQDTTDVTRLEEAFHLVQVVNARSLEAEQDSLLWSTYKSKKAADIEQLVLSERQRELAFEGKRWYDLLRYNYRHVEGVNYNTILAQQGGGFVENSQDMLNLMKQKLGSSGDAVASKTATEPRLYLPVPLADLKVSSLLLQMPTYSSDETISKN